MAIRRTTIAITLFFILISSAFPRPQADTVRLTLDGAEKLFLQRNYQLLVAKYNIYEAEANVIQAKLWNNPTLSIQQGMYDTQRKRWFEMAKSGQTAVSIGQLIYLGGKHRLRVNLEKLGVQLSTQQFYDLIRALRYELRTDFYDLFFLKQRLAIYDKEIESTKSLLTGFQIQYKNGNVPLREVARLEAMQFGLENERMETLKTLSEKQSNLSLLTGDTLLCPISPVVDLQTLHQKDVAALQYDQLLDSALVNRYDLKGTLTQIKMSQTNLALQKSLRIPDVTVSAGWDKNGGYIPNFNAVNLQFDLPTWNRNQGNIRHARYEIEQSRLQYSQAQQTLQSDLKRTLSLVYETDKLYKSASGKFDNNYETLMSGVAAAYQKHTISLLEFIDYYETYKNSKLELLRVQQNRLNALEELHMVVGN